MQAFGAYRNDKNEPCIDHISHPVSLFTGYADYLQTANIVARFLESTYTLLSALHLYYRNQQPATVGPQQGFPYYNAQSSIIYTDHLCHGIFQGLYKAGTDVAIKFVYGKYGLEVHQHLASKGLAPKILHHKTLGLGWTVIYCHGVLLATNETHFQFDSRAKTYNGRQNFDCIQG